MSEIRVIIIDQSNHICRQLKQTLQTQQNIKVVGYTNNRLKGLNLIKTLQPHVILIDIFFLRESDWQTTLFQSNSIIILARPLVDEVAKTLKAISLGAVDFINKTDLNEKNIQIELISKISNASKRDRIDTQSDFINSPQKNEQAEQQQTAFKKIKQIDQNTVIAIGTSTGGPKALQKILRELPKDFPAPIFIVQHMPSGFTKSLAKRLNHYTELNVKEASNGEVVKAGTVYVAPGNYHMVVTQQGKKLITHLHQDNLKQGHRPSVDILFNSLAKLNGLDKIAIILTGMGKDGAEGVKAIKTRDSSAIIIAESEQSATIYGMPQAALETNCVTNIAHIDEVGKMLKNNVER